MNILLALYAIAAFVVALIAAIPIYGFMYGLWQERDHIRRIRRANCYDSRYADDRQIDYALALLESKLDRLEAGYLDTPRNYTQVLGHAIAMENEFTGGLGLIGGGKAPSGLSSSVTSSQAAQMQQQLITQAMYAQMSPQAVEREYGDQLAQRGLHMAAQQSTGLIGLGSAARQRDLANMFSPFH